MKKIINTLFFLLLVAVCLAQVPNLLPPLPETNLNIIVANDMGRRGKSEQQNIARLMGEVAEQNKIAFMAIPGDPIHDNGVKSIDDEEWNLKIENIYTAPSLYTFPWYVVPGNHEYRGNVQAIIDYSNKSERWNAPARYYASVFFIGESKAECLLIFIDTTPLIDKYRVDKASSDAGQQDMKEQLEWLEQLLASSKARWKIVFGHHPVYADTEKEASERTDMQTRVGTILENHNVDFYISGHIHNFQHIKPTGKHVNYVVNSSASQSRVVKETDGTLFCNGDPGFTLFSISTDTAQCCFVNHTGAVVYNTIVTK